MNSRLIFRLLVLALLFTGLAQMPIFARYYLADVPGFSWTADYYLNHVLHYVFAVALLILLFQRIPAAFKKRPIAVQLVLTLCWSGIVGTGMVRVMKNQPDAFFTPTWVMIVDWAHLGFVMLLGLVTLVVTLTNRKTNTSS